MRCVFFALILLTGIACSEDEPQKLYSTFELESPQLEVTKKIWLYLPADYNETTKRYPVIYFSDAQWLFESNPNYSQEMHLDETMREMEMDGFEGAIVVGIESDETTRHNDFSLFVNLQFRQGGNAQAYLDFITQTLKPEIDQTYRTKTDRENTTIMGASLGGMACVFALTEYPEVFGKAALFSAALHFNKDSIFAKAGRGEIRTDARITGVVGEFEFNENVNFPEDNQKFFDILKEQRGSTNGLRLKIDEDGTHTISYWEREFPAIMEFLFP